MLQNQAGYFEESEGLSAASTETDKFVEDAKKLAGYCAAHPDNGLITAADAVFAE